MMRKKIKTTILTCMLMMFSINVIAQETNQYDWTKVMNAIIQVESGGNPKAHNPNGDCVGILQITKICVKEANKILESKGLTKRYSLSDRWNLEKSKEIFILIQNKYNPEKDVIKACRIWNEGPFYNKKIKTTSYVKKVLKKME